LICFVVADRPEFYYRKGQGFTCEISSSHGGKYEVQIILHGSTSQKTKKKFYFSQSCPDRLSQQTLKHITCLFPKLRTSETSLHRTEEELMSLPSQKFARSLSWWCHTVTTLVSLNTGASKTQSWGDFQRQRMFTEILHNRPTGSKFLG
jgi:hypothetical protein